VSNTDDKPSDVRIRRAPKIPTFLILGGGLGAIVSFILTALFPVDPAVGFGALFGYFALYGVTGGVLLGAIVAIVLDRRSLKRVSTAQVVVESTVRPDEYTNDNEAGSVDDAARSDENSATPADFAQPDATQPRAENDPDARA
jgi:hypothetical protein